MKRSIRSMPVVLLLALLTAGTVEGGVPTSTNYALPSEVVSGGGAPAASASYRYHGSIGQSATLGLSGDPAYLHKGGFWNLGVVDTDAPALLFLLPGSYTRLNVPVTQLNASDTGSSVTGFYVSSSPLPPDPFSAAGWQGTAPTEVTAPGVGSSTFYAWARDEAGNLSGGASATIDIAYLKWLLSVILAGSGGTSVTSTPAGINCLAGNSGDCSFSFTDGDTVTLASAAAWNAHLSGWSACGGSGDCAVLMDADKHVDATFATNTNVRLNDAPPTLHSKIMDAYGAIGHTGSGTIQAQTFSFLETLEFANPVDVVLQGGRDADFNPSAGYTTVGRMVIKSGSVRAGNIKIK